MTIRDDGGGQVVSYLRGFLAEGKIYLVSFGFLNYNLFAETSDYAAI
jgi:hypothetical protein